MTATGGVLAEAPSPRGARLEAAELVGGVLTHAPDGDGLRFLPALDRLCSAISDEARLTEAGRRSTQRALVSALVLQLRLHRLLERHPEIERLPFDGPLVVVGLFRTGTTLLQNLLAQHPDVRVPQLWELMHPISRDGSAAERARLIRVTQAYVQAYYRAAPAFRAIHYLDAELPEECHRLIATTFTSDIYPLRYRIPSYVDWLAGPPERRRPRPARPRPSLRRRRRRPAGRRRLRLRVRGHPLDGRSGETRPPLPRAEPEGPPRPPSLRAGGVRREPRRARGTARRLQEGVRTMTVQAQAPVEETHEDRARRA